MILRNNSLCNEWSEITILLQYLLLTLYFLIICRSVILVRLFPIHQFWLFIIARIVLVVEGGRWKRLLRFIILLVERKLECLIWIIPAILISTLLVEVISLINSIEQNKLIVDLLLVHGLIKLADYFLIWLYEVLRLVFGLNIAVHVRLISFKQKRGILFILQYLFKINIIQILLTELQQLPFQWLLLCWLLCCGYRILPLRTTRCLLLSFDLFQYSFHLKFPFFPYFLSLTILPLILFRLLWLRRIEWSGTSMAVKRDTRWHRRLASWLFELLTCTFWTAIPINLFRCQFFNFRKQILSLIKWWPGHFDLPDYIISISLQPLHLFQSIFSFQLLIKIKDHGRNVLILFFSDILVSIDLLVTHFHNPDIRLRSHPNKLHIFHSYYLSAINPVLPALHNIYVTVSLELAKLIRFILQEQILSCALGFAL